MLLGHQRAVKLSLAVRAFPNKDLCEIFFPVILREQSDRRISFLAARLFHAAPHDYTQIGNTGRQKTRFFTPLRSVQNDRRDAFAEFLSRFSLKGQHKIFLFRGHVYNIKKTVEDK
ncbi:MAG: hypothetical protein C4567_04820 [Deltaproteobacteria bacterium]|nr:MAG: hypothetical protein C4567_04820 [Deltaproteobacteria bacterium]